MVPQINLIKKAVNQNWRYNQITQLKTHCDCWALLYTFMFSYFTVWCLIFQSCYSFYYMPCPPHRPLDGSSSEDTKIMLAAAEDLDALKYSIYYPGKMCYMQTIDSRNSVADGHIKAHICSSRKLSPYSWNQRGCFFFFFSPGTSCRLVYCELIKIWCNKLTRNRYCLKG